MSLEIAHGSSIIAFYSLSLEIFYYILRHMMEQLIYIVSTFCTSLEEA